MLPKLIAFAVTSGLAKKAWDHYRAGKRRPPEDITNLVGRPEAVDPGSARRRKATPARRRKEGPGA